MGLSESPPIAEQRASVYPVDYLASLVKANGNSYDSQGAIAGRYLDDLDLVATEKRDRLDGRISKVRIEAFGTSAGEVQATLMEMGERCDAASEAPSCSYGECVIEADLAVPWGSPYKWHGRLTIYPDIGQPLAPDAA